MIISTQDISQLRATTGAGMMDCKKALEEANGDKEKAAEILRKKGIVKAAKRADKTAAEGLVQIKVQGKTAVMVEVNSETDFVAKNDDFKMLIEKIMDSLLENKPANLEQALNVEANGNKKTQDLLTELTGKIGEKLSFRRFVVLEKNDNEVFGSYTHMGGKIGVLILLVGGTEELARDIAMHAAAANPKYLDRSQIANDVLEKEKEIYSEQLKVQNKPANIIENILKGKLEKFYEEVCLLDQVYIKDDSKKVGQMLGGDVKIKQFIRYELGEGIEKKSSDFAAEVNAQL